MIKIDEIKPMFDQLLVTTEKYLEDQYEGGLLMAQKGDLKEVQTVYAVGDYVKRNNIIHEGDKVLWNARDYEVKKYSDGSMKNNIIDVNRTVAYNFDTIEVGGITYLKLKDRDIDGIVLKCHQTNEKPKKQKPKAHIITPDKPKVIIPGVPGATIDI
jgi:co-chaperonin GroES (HSP10)